MLALSVVAAGFLSIQEESIGGLDIDGNLVKDAKVEIKPYKKWLETSI